MALAVSNIAKFTAKPTEQYWRPVKHILQYLAGTTNFGLLFTMNETPECTGYSDAD